MKEYAPTEYEALEPEQPEPEKAIENFSDFTPEQQKEILVKKEKLSLLPRFIGKNFEIPVELNTPGAGWHWDFKNDIIRIDPADLCFEVFSKKREQNGQRPLSQEEHEDYLRFVICHEGFHKRLTETSFIEPQEWRQTGFGFGINVPEDGRINTAGAEYYPKFAKQMNIAYEQEVDFENKSKEKAGRELGRQPRFMQAGFEVLRLWFQWHKGEKMIIDESLPDQVKEYVKQLLPEYESFWGTFPAKAMSDGAQKDEYGLTGEKSISQHSKDAYEIYKNTIWPEFKKLVDADIRDQKMQEALKSMQKSEKGEEKEEESPMKPKGGAQPVDVSSLPEEKKQEIKDYIDSLPEEQQEEIEKSASDAVKEFEDSLNEELQGKLSDNPDRKSEAKEEKTPEPKKEEKGDWVKKEQERGGMASRKKVEAALETGEKSTYEKTMEEISGLIDKLTTDLRDIFIQRKEEKYETDHRSGRRWNIRKRIREKVENIPLFKTQAREQQESESEEMDYAFAIAVDLSGSMESNKKIQESFKAAVMWSEVLNNLGIDSYVAGFQDIVLDFKSFDDHMDDRVRDRMSQMVLEVYGKNPGGHNNPRDNDDGKCLREISEVLSRHSAKNKFLVVISDGIPETGYKNRDQLDRELKEVVAEISNNTSQKLIGLGLNSDAVKKYYPNNIAGVDAKEMAETLAGLLREVIEKY